MAASTAPDASRPPRPPRPAGSRRIVIAAVRPQVEGGRHALRRVVGEVLSVHADVFCDGDVAVRACILYRVPGESRWRPAPLRQDDGGVSWSGRLRLQNGGTTRYRIEAWVDVFATWERRVRQSLQGADGALPLRLLLPQGVAILDQAMTAATGADLRLLADCGEALQRCGDDRDALAHWLRDRELHKRMLVHGERRHVVRSEPVLEVVAERRRAAFCMWGHVPAGDSAWRQDGPDRTALLRAGVEIVHPEARRPGDGDAPPGASADFEVAANLSLPFAPDAGWAEAHAGWFRHEDTPPDAAPRLEFWCDDRRSLWEACLDVVLDRVRRGARLLFAPYATDVPLPFWGWLLRRVHRLHPEVLFVSGAVAPAWAGVLARHGFSQSRVVWEPDLRRAAQQVADWARPRHPEWRAAVDVPAMPEESSLGPAALELRLLQLLAATSAACFGIRGVPRDAEALAWLQRLQQWRREHRALQTTTGLRRLESTNPDVFAFVRGVPTGRHAVVVILSLGCDRPQEGRVVLPPGFGGADADDDILLEDVLDGNRYTWRTGSNPVALGPEGRSAHVLRLVRAPVLLP